MPYENEFAGYRPLRRIAMSTRVRSLLTNYEVRQRRSTQVDVAPLSADRLEPSEWTPDWILAVDGSHAEVSIENGYPGAEASYITVASVLLDLGKLRQLDADRPVDPKEYRTTERAESIDCALPGCNVVFNGEHSSEASLRRAIIDVLESVRMSAGGETLLDTYEVLLGYKPAQAREQRCPYDDCLAPNRVYQRGIGRYTCTCQLGRPLYSSDALRFAEGMNPGGTNGATFAEIMQVLERVWIIHILRTLEENKWLSSLRRLAVVLDGPLAVFGHPAWLSQAISQELRRLNEVARRVNGGQDLMLLGVEKTGAFTEHFNLLDQQSSGEQGRLPTRSVLLLDDEYIKTNIIPSDSTKPYGQDTYFGRKLLYKTASGAKIVVTLPFLDESHRDLSRADVNQFPRLADATRLLDQLVSSRYPNAVVPLVAAHAEAAIPLNLGRQVLERLARELVGSSRE